MARRPRRGTRDIKIELVGDLELIRKLDKLPDAVQRRIAKDVINKALVPLNAEARRLVPVDSGLLKKSIGILRPPKVYRGSGVVVSFVGPRTGFKKSVDGVLKNPTKYAHLVELGTSSVRAQPFLRPALKNKKSAVQAIFSKELGPIIIKEMRKIK